MVYVVWWYGYIYVDVYTYSRWVDRWKQFQAKQVKTSMRLTRQLDIKDFINQQVTMQTIDLTVEPFVEPPE